MVHKVIAIAEAYLWHTALTLLAHVDVSLEISVEAGRITADVQTPEEACVPLRLLIVSLLLLFFIFLLLRLW